MSYRVWAHDESGRWARLARRPATFDPLVGAVSEGQPARSVGERPIALEIHPRYGGALADNIPNSWSLMVVTAKLGQLVAASCADIELLRAEVRDTGRQRVSTSHSVLNVLTRYRCVDLRRSRYHADFEAGRIADFVELVLDESRIGAPNQLFRLAEAPTIVVVHEDLCRRLEREGLTGLRFVPIQDYNRRWS